MERERERLGGAEREGERETIPSRLCTVSPELNPELEPKNGEFMTSAETKSQLLNQLSHPGAPPLHLYFDPVRNEHCIKDHFKSRVRKYPVTMRMVVVCAVLFYD